MLVDAWTLVHSRNPDWVLQIYGDGQKDKFTKQIVDNKLTSCCFLFDSVKDLNEKFLESSIFAFSSRFEGFGMVITEAMSCGLPPVSFSCPCGPKDIIEDGISGFLVEPGDVRSLADKINYLIEHDNERKRIGANAKQRSKLFKIESIAEEWNNLFKELIMTAE